MEQTWVPVIKPPHPSSVRSISKFTENVIITLRKNAYEKSEEMRRLRQYNDNTQIVINDADALDDDYIDFHGENFGKKRNRSSEDQCCPQFSQKNQQVIFYHKPEQKQQRVFPTSTLSIGKTLNNDCISSTNTLQFYHKRLENSLKGHTTNSNSITKGENIEINKEQLQKGEQVSTYVKFTAVSKPATNDLQFFEGKPFIKPKLGIQCTPKVSVQIKGNHENKQSTINEIFKEKKCLRNINPVVEPKATLVEPFNELDEFFEENGDSELMKIMDDIENKPINDLARNNLLKDLKKAEVPQEVEHHNKEKSLSMKLETVAVKYNSEKVKHAMEKFAFPKKITKAEPEKKVLPVVKSINTFPTHKNNGNENYSIAQNSFTEQSNFDIKENAVIKKPKLFVSHESLELNGNSSNQKCKRNELDITPKSTSTEMYKKENNLSQTTKRKKFEAPLKSKKLVQTKIFERSESIPIIELNNSSVQDLERQIIYSTPSEVVVLIQYADGETQASKTFNSNSYKAIYFRIQWTLDNVEYCRTEIGSSLWTTGKQNFKKFLQSLLSSSSSIVSIEAAELMLLLIHKLHFSQDETLQWNVLDPLVGYWLWESDKPCGTFEDLILALQIDKTELRKYYDVETKTCKYLDVMSQCFKCLKKRLKADGVWSLYVDLEVKLTPILARMTYKGIQIDDAKLRNLGDMLGKKLDSLQKEAHKLAGRPFMINSAQQLRRILFTDLQLDQKNNIKVKETSTGVKSTSEAVLKQLIDFHKLPGLILEYRGLQKIKSTYIDGLLNCTKKGIINAIWEQRSAATGRLASSNPNVQSLPRDWTSFTSDSGETIQFNVRSFFRPRSGYVFLLADFQQIEFRIFAHLAEDKELCQIFHKSDDVFMSLAQHWLGKEGQLVDKNDREKTKRIVYAAMYGAGSAKVAELLNISHAEATEILNNFNERFPGLKNLTKIVSDKCSETDGIIRTIQGRIRRLGHIRDTSSSSRAQAERQAINFLIQGAAADICKQAMLLIEFEFSKASNSVDAHLLLQIHDELIWEVSEQSVARAKDIVQRVMEDADALNGYKCQFKVPLRAKIQIQNNLSEFHHDENSNNVFLKKANK